MAFVALAYHDDFRIICHKGGFLIAEVMASRGYKVQPLPRVPRHDTVQVRIFSIIFRN